MLRALLCALLARLGGGVIGTPSVRRDVDSTGGAQLVGGALPRTRAADIERESQPVLPASPRPPRAAHRPAAARTPRRMKKRELTKK